MWTSRAASWPSVNPSSTNRASSHSRSPPVSRWLPMPSSATPFSPAATPQRFSSPSGACAFIRAPRGGRSQRSAKRSACVPGCIPTASAGVHGFRTFGTYRDAETHRVVSRRLGRGPAHAPSGHVPRSRRHGGDLLVHSGGPRVLRLATNAWRQPPAETADDCGESPGPPPAILHRPAPIAARCQSPHHRVLPGRIPAPARFRLRAREPVAVPALCGGSRYDADQRLPRPLGARARQ